MYHTDDELAGACLRDTLENARHREALGRVRDEKDEYKMGRSQKQRRDRRGMIQGSAGELGSPSSALSLRNQSSPLLPALIGVDRQSATGKLRHPQCGSDMHWGEFGSD